MKPVFFDTYNELECTKLDFLKQSQELGYHYIINFEGYEEPEIIRRTYACTHNDILGLFMKYSFEECTGIVKLIGQAI